MATASRFSRSAITDSSEEGSGIPVVAAPPRHLPRIARYLTKALRAIADAVRAKGHRLSHEGVAGVLRP